MWQYCQKIFAKRINSLYLADKVLKSIIAAEYKLEGYKMPKSWMEAFFLLEQLLQGQDKGERQVIFIDELPWMDTPRSGFLPAFENFRNGWSNAQFKQKQRKVKMREMNCKWLRMSNIS